MLSEICIFALPQGSYKANFLLVSILTIITTSLAFEPFHIWLQIYLWRETECIINRIKIEIISRRCHQPFINKRAVVTFWLYLVLPLNFLLTEYYFTLYAKHINFFCYSSVSLNYWYRHTKSNSITSTNYR